MNIGCALLIIVGVGEGVDIFAVAGSNIFSFAIEHGFFELSVVIACVSEKAMPEGGFLGDGGGWCEWRLELGGATD